MRGRGARVEGLRLSRTVRWWGEWFLPGLIRQLVEFGCNRCRAVERLGEGIGEVGVVGMGLLWV